MIPGSGLYAVHMDRPCQASGIPTPPGATRASSERRGTGSDKAVRRLGSSSNAFTRGHGCGSCRNSGIGAGWRHAAAGRPFVAFGEARRCFEQGEPRAHPGAGISGLLEAKPNESAFEALRPGRRRGSPREPSKAKIAIYLAMYCDNAHMSASIHYRRPSWRMPARSKRPSGGPEAAGRSLSRIAREVVEKRSGGKTKSSITARR